MGRQQEICVLVPASSAATHDTRKAATLDFEGGYESEDLESWEPLPETKEALCFLEIHAIVDIQGAVQVEAPTDALLPNVATQHSPTAEKAALVYARKCQKVSQVRWSAEHLAPPPIAMPLSIHPPPTDITAQCSVVIPEHLEPPTAMPLSIHPTPTDITAQCSVVIPEHLEPPTAMPLSIHPTPTDITAKESSTSNTKMLIWKWNERQGWVPEPQQTHPVAHHVRVEPATPELVSWEGHMMPYVTDWQASKRTKFKRGSKQTNNMYTCAYCGQIKTSFSGSADSGNRRVRIRCECGGRYRDGKLRMHCSWNLANGQRVDNHNGEGWVFVDDKSKQQHQQVTVGAQIAKLQNAL